MKLKTFIAVLLTGSFFFYSGFTWSSNTAQKSKAERVASSNEKKGEPQSATTNSENIETKPIKIPPSGLRNQTSAAMPALIPPSSRTAIRTPIPETMPDLTSIQRQIDSILQANKTLKNDYVQQAAEVQRITEQARIHERILKNLEIQKNVRIAQDLKPLRPDVPKMNELDTAIASNVPRKKSD